MDLPSSLKWIEVDLPELLSYKEAILKNEAPRCLLERVALDLSNAAARRELFDRLARQASKVLIITEGILVYLSAEEVVALAQDLRAPSSFQRWAVDLASPGLLRILQRHLQPKLDLAGRNVEIRPQRRTVVLCASRMETDRGPNIAEDGCATEPALVLDAARGKTS